MKARYLPLEGVGEESDEEVETEHGRQEEPCANQQRGHHTVNVHHVL